MSVDATARSGFTLLGGAAVTTTAGGFLLDPSTLVPYDFTSDELLVEVWLRYMVAANAPSPIFKLFVNGEDGSSITPVRYDLENGSGGLSVIAPSGASRRFARLGVVPIRYSDHQQRRRVQIVIRYDITAIGTTVSFDYVMLLPAGKRATSPTGRLDDGNYPDFMVSTSSQQTRRVFPNMGGELGPAREQFAVGNLNPAGGIVSSKAMEFSAPNADVAVKLSNVVPNGGVAADAAESLSLASDATITASFNVTPRFLTLR